VATAAGAGAALLPAVLAVGFPAAAEELRKEALVKTAAGAALPPPAVPAVEGHAAPSQAASNDECSVCMERQPNVVLFPCVHMCLCERCSINLASEPCPMCRVPRTGSLLVYRS